MAQIILYHRLRNLVINHVSALLPSLSQPTAAAATAHTQCHNRYEHNHTRHDQPNRPGPENDESIKVNEHNVINTTILFNNLRAILHHSTEIGDGGSQIIP